MTSFAVLPGGNALCFLFSVKGFKAFMPKNVVVLPRKPEAHSSFKGTDSDVMGLIRIGT